MFNNVRFYIDILITVLVLAAYMYMLMEDRNLKKQIHVISIKHESKFYKFMYIMGLFLLITNGFDLLNGMINNLHSELNIILGIIFKNLSGLVTGLLIIYIHKPSLKIKEKGIIYKGTVFLWKNITKFEIKDDKLLYLRVVCNEDIKDINIKMSTEDNKKVVSILSDYIN